MIKAAINIQGGKLVCTSADHNFNFLKFVLYTIPGSGPITGADSNVCFWLLNDFVDCFSAVYCTNYHKIEDAIIINYHVFPCPLKHHRSIN